MNKKGYTLVELMIYMVLGLLVVGYSMNAMKQISTNYVRGREVTKLQQNGRDAINLMARDLVNTGFKYYIKKDTLPNPTSGGNYVSYQTLPDPSIDSDDTVFLYGSYTGTYVDPAGSVPADSAASFYCGQGNPYDTIEVFRSRLIRTDLVNSVERTRYNVQNDTLFRITQTCTNKALNASGDIDWGADEKIAVVANVKALQFQYSRDGLNWVHNPASSKTRDEMKYIKIELVMSSDRTDEIVSTQPIAVGDITVTPDGSHIYRSYEQVVAILNNGVLKGL